MSNSETLSKLRAKLDLMVKPSHTEFFSDATKGMTSKLSESEFECAYKHADKEYTKAYSKYIDEVEALRFAISHYEGQVKLELALSLIS